MEMPSTLSTPDEGASTVTFTTISLVVYVSSGVLVVLYFLLLGGCIFSNCNHWLSKKKSLNSSKVSEEVFQGHAVDQRNVYDHPEPISTVTDVKKTDAQDNRAGTITTVVQINLGDLPQGMTSLTRNQSLPPRNKTIERKFRGIEFARDKAGSLPKYENTPKRGSKKDLQYVVPNKPESDYDYPAMYYDTQKRANQGPSQGMSGYMSVLPDKNKESPYDSVFH